MDLLEKKQAMEELLKERRNTEVEEWSVTVVAEGGVAHKAAAGSRSSEAGGQKDTEEGQASSASSKTFRVGGDTRICVSAPADKSLG